MERETRGIVFKGSAEGLIIVIPDEYSFERVKEEVEAKVNSAAKFFNGAKIKVLYRGINLSEQEEQELKVILDEKSGAIIESLSKNHEPLTNNHTIKNSPRVPTATKKNFFSQTDESACKFVKSTVRSGTRISFDGSVVVMGDVNPGGEIVANGNVIILGSLRGMVHAGADGQQEAFVYALKLKPTQIRIAGAIARTPDEDGEEGMIYPEIARMSGGMIIVERVY